MAGPSKALQSDVVATSAPQADECEEEAPCAPHGGPAGTSEKTAESEATAVGVELAMIMLEDEVAAASEQAEEGKKEVARLQEARACMLNAFGGGNMDATDSG